MNRVATVVLVAAGALAPALAAPGIPAAEAAVLPEIGRAVTACGPGGVGDRLVPDRGPWFAFGAACASHDACYAAQLGRGHCDERFRDELQAHCAARIWYQRAPCRHTAELYLEAVRRFGHLFY
jgi:hypothetical protein